LERGGFGGRVATTVASVAGATWAWVRGLAPERGTLRSDVVAGLPCAISSVPDGMATSVLIGVNPVHGLYACLFGPVGGGLTSSTRLMVITTTNAAALAAGSALSSVAGPERPRALFLLTMIAGAAMVLAGWFKLGRYTRFVPHSVMIGFLSGVAVNILLGQLPNLFGISTSGPYPLARAWNLMGSLGETNVGSLICGVAALVVIIALMRTRLAPFSALIALVVPSAAVAIVGSHAVKLVGDVGDIPAGLPLPSIPHLSDLSFEVIVGALSVTALVLVQGAGVSEAAPNPDRSRSNSNQDFAAQGVGNLVSGLFQGQPVGGSVGQTAVNVAAGARGRWSVITSGLWMAVILLLFSGVIGKVVMSTLAAVLILASVGSFRSGSVRAILRTGRVSQIAVIATFVATLFLPVAAAVGAGLVISLLMQMNQEAQDLRIVQLIPQPDGRFTEHPAPRTLASREVVLLDVYGSLFYAGARTLQAHLPDPAHAQHPAVVLRLRGRVTLGATSFAVLADYAERLAAVGGCFYLSGVDPALMAQIDHNRTLEQAGNVRVFEVTKVVGETSLEAYHAARAWLADIAQDSADE
jgi:sulfate permease, SulP family